MTQTISLLQDVNNLKLTSDGKLTLDVVYTADNPNLSTFGLQIFFNEGVTLTSVENIFSTNIVDPVVANETFDLVVVSDVATNADNDPNTTQVFNSTWADIFDGTVNWPGTVPVKLYTLNFEVAENVTPIIRFFPSAQPTGQDFVGPNPDATDDQLITVTAVNVKPVFAPLTYAASLVQRSTAPVATVVATDADNDTLTYSISAGNLDIDGDGNLAFAIAAATGVITVNDAGDLLFGNAAITDNKFTLTVSASDGFESAATNATVTVNITNAAPTFGTFDPVSIDEDSDVGTPIGTFTADAVDGDTLTYSIFSGNTNVDGDGDAAFTINSETGAITVNDSGDLVFATQPTFELVVRASDPFGATADTTVVVNLNEVDKGGIIGQGISAADFVLNNLTLAAGQTFTVKNEVRSNATLNNLIAFYRIDDLTGAIDGVKVDDDGYLAKALSRIENDVLIRGQGENNASGSGGGSSFTNDTGATAHYAPILIANGGRLESVFDLLEINSANNASEKIGQPAAYFIFDDANAKLSSSKSVGNFFFDASTSSLRVEDVHSSIADKDYNDLSFSF